VMNSRRRIPPPTSGDGILPPQARSLIGTEIGCKNVPMVAAEMALINA